MISLKLKIHWPIWLQRIREITDGGVDYSFECIGNLDVLREAFLSTHEVASLFIILYDLFVCVVYFNFNEIHGEKIYMIFCFLIAGVGVYCGFGNSSNPKNAPSPSNGVGSWSTNYWICVWRLQREVPTPSFCTRMHARG